MTKLIRFFRNKEEEIPYNSYELIAKNKQTNNTIIDNPSTRTKFTDEWLKMYPNGKVDFICTP